MGKCPGLDDETTAQVIRRLHLLSEDPGVINAMSLEAARDHLREGWDAVETVNVAPFVWLLRSGRGWAVTILDTSQAGWVLARDVEEPSIRVDRSSLVLSMARMSATGADVVGLFAGLDAVIAKFGRHSEPLMAARALLRHEDLYAQVSTPEARMLYALDGRRHVLGLVEEMHGQQRLRLPEDAWRARGKDRRGDRTVQPSAQTSGADAPIAP